MKLKRISSILMITMLITSSVSWTTFASTTVQKTNNNNNSQRYIVKFKNSNANANQVVSNYNGKLKKQFKNVNTAVADVKPQDVVKLQKDPNIAYVEKDHVVKVAATTVSNWGVSDIKAPASWESGLTGKGVKIGVIDTGVASHSDLSIAGGVNVISGAATSYADDNGHGTHVAGIIGGKGVNGGVKGVAPDSSIYAVKALDSSGSGYTSDIIAGIDWAIQNKMDIVSMSLGSSESDVSLQNAVDTAYSKGILVVAAAGNDGNSSGTGTNVNYPANYSSVIAVGAVDSSNTRASFSSTGSKVEVSAPGVNVASTYLNGGYVQMSGTSMATPFVSGDLALLKQKYPNYTNVQLRQLLDSNIVDLGVQGRDSFYGYGLIQAPNNGTTVSLPNVPNVNVAAGIYTSAQTITLSDSTSGVSIYYTLDGTTPTVKSNLYTTPIIINSTKTLKAVAIDANGNTSGVLSNTYIINSTIPLKPIASVPGGTYSTNQIVSLSDRTSGVSIYYTLDGTIPTVKSNLYSKPITISSTKTLKAIAVDSNGKSSDVLSELYKITTTSVIIPTPTTNIVAGTYKTPLFVKLYDNYSKPLMAYYTLDGSTPTTKSLPYIGYINITSSCTLKVIAVDYYGNTSQVLTTAYNIIKPLSAPILSKGTGIYNKAQTITLSNNTSGVSIYYTLDGSTPTINSNLYKGPININNSTLLKAVAIDSSGNSSSITSALYIIFNLLF
ncbi:Serine protease, subtilisin family [Clostridium cavendishii DSM 21758]|uniref:Serine protease, subtilisin family n=1 Tax=Clostridium cavendishii DSM 21758 TaxID=1121302 RepID=A0A1M6T9L6_9CLOT|nr:chitobiase/beta-hexosaminidase C-terminal domain-containing protein [Clostridium cavendishii]SHK53762.1 Serine protease, subtilisin family [Clostridium cavendishii DSM 21758]